MKYMRIFADGSGESHLDEVEIPLTEASFAPPAAPFPISERLEAKNLIFCMIPRGWVGDWHPTPARQYFILLSGVLEVEVSDGEVWRATPGSAVLVEDTSGKGHVTRVVGDSSAQGVFIQLP